MAQAAHALSAPNPARNPAHRSDLVAALRNEWAAAVSVWATLLPGSRKEVKVCAQLLELKARLLHAASAGGREVRHA